jgi:hypothetical protein
MAFALTACGGGSGGAAAPATNLQGPPGEILEKVLTEAVSALPADKPAPMTFTTEVTAETSQNQIGLSGADFDKYVESASVATAVIGTFPHEIGMIEAKDAASAAEVKKLIAGDGGDDSNKWICVFPERSYVVESGHYVLLAVSRADVVEAVLAAFTEEAGNVGEVDEFFSFSGEQPEGGGGMGIAIGGGPAAL